MRGREEEGGKVRKGRRGGKKDGKGWDGKEKLAVQASISIRKASQDKVDCRRVELANKKGSNVEKKISDIHSIDSLECIE